MNKHKWWITTEHRRGRYRWSIPYPLNKFAITGTTDYASVAAARKAAYRAIRRLFPEQD